MTMNVDPFMVELQTKAIKTLKDCLENKLKIGDNYKGDFLTRQDVENIKKLWENKEDVMKYKNDEKWIWYRECSSNDYYRRLLLFKGTEVRG